MDAIKITAKDVAALRKQTGAGMMDCKKALVEANGDMEAAKDILRKKGQKLSLKRADRDANEGVVIAQTSGNNKQGVVVYLSCETDFVAKNADFVALTQRIADLALAEFPATKEDLLNLEFEGMKLSDKVVEQVGVIGEKVELAAYARLESPLVVPYIHAGYKRGVLIGLNKEGEFIQVGKDIAMQVAAMGPVAVDKDDVDESVVQKEIEIGMEQARNEGKPENLLEKIARGKLNKFYQENTLLNQEYVRSDSKQNVRAYLQSIDKDLTVTAFEHIALGG